MKLFNKMLERTWYVATLVFIVAALLAAALIWQLEDARVREARGHALSLATERAQAIQSNMERAFSAAYAIGAMVRQGKGEVSEFTDIATQMLPFYPGVGSIQMARGGVVSHIVPLAGNEKAIGNDLLADPERNKEAFLARDTGHLTLAGPFTLKQGGLGAVARLPVYLGSANDRSNFWGFAVVLLRFPQSLEPAQLPLLVQRGYHYQLWRIHPDTQVKQVISASSEQALVDPVTRQLTVPNATWELSISPVDGWNDTLGLLFKITLGMIFSALLAGLTKLLLDSRNHEKLLEYRVALRTNDLQRFAEITAHHLQEPARRMASYADLLGQQLAGRLDDPSAQLSLDFIGQQARYQQNLLRDVQRYLAADQPLSEVRRVDTAAVVGRVVHKLTGRIAACGARIDVGNLPPVWFDAARLSDVFELLLDNALRHGAVTHPLHIRIAGERVGGVLRYCVSDNGPGIEAQYRERVFRAFERLQAGGTDSGIGLALVRRILESGGGRAWIDETAGGGCSVWFELPHTESAP